MDVLVVQKDNLPLILITIQYKQNRRLFEILYEFDDFREEYKENPV